MTRQRNTGHLPAEARGKRVRVWFADGREARYDIVQGWAADGQGGCRWTRTGSAFDIDEYEVIG